jgi:Na+/melibiose symporter-like transporter
MILSVIFGYFKNGAPDYVDILRRSLIAALLIASFPEVSQLILTVCNGVATRIDNLSGLNEIMRMAQEKADSYSLAKSALLLKFDDLIIAGLSFLSLIVLLVARYLCIALYYFYWILLSALSPILILFYVFPSTAGITKGLYRGLIEVACWKIVWAVQSAMLTALSFGNIYQTNGSYVTLIVLNIVIAVGMLFTPMIVKSLAGEGVQSTAQTVGSVAAAAMVALPAKIAFVGEKGRALGGAAQRITRERFRRLTQNQRR